MAVDSSSFDYLFKLLLMGDSSVGKSSLLFRFSDDAFSNNYVATTGIDFKIKTVELDGKRIKLQIWDTAGQERFKTITKSYYRGAMGIMLVYDITSTRSFENINNWLMDIKEYGTEGVEKILVGNKCEMEEIREVSKERAQAVAEKHEMYFLETSAKANINVDDVFGQLSRQILDKIKSQGVPLQRSQGGIGLRESNNSQVSSSQSGCCSR